VYYLPALLGGSVAIAMLWRQVFGMQGLVNQLFSFLGLEALAGISWVSHPDYSTFTLILLRVWQFGSPMIIFLAGLKQIPHSYYESANIDGAGRLTQFVRITIPLLTPIILFNMIMQIISAFQSFTGAYVLGRAGGSGSVGGTMDSLLLYTVYLYQRAFTQFKMGYASAMAWTLLITIAGLTVLLFRSSRSWVHYES
jgi:multiple sugar transport system permease protein